MRKPHYASKGLKELILLNDNQSPLISADPCLTEDFKGSKDELIKTLENNMKCGIAFVKIEKISANQVQVNEFQGDHGKAIMVGSTEPDYETIKSELELLKLACVDDVKIALENAIGAAKMRDESKLKKALKTVLETEKSIFENVAADVTVAYLRANGIAP